MNVPRMNVIATLSAGLQGALLLARGNPEGLRLVENDHASVRYSFWAIPLCLPAVIGMKLMSWGSTKMPPQAALNMGRYLLLFVIGWLLFVWVSHHLSAALKTQARWPRFIALWAYCSVIGNTLAALGTVPGLLGVPSMLSQASEVVTYGWAIWLEWYAIRLSLEVGGLTAAGLVVLDILISVAMAVLASVGSSQ